MATIIDTDPGIDDAMTIYYAHGSERTELQALTTIFGNVTIEDATNNALWLGESCGADLPVYPGEARPLSIDPNRPSDHVHGPHGLGPLECRPERSAAETRSAAEYLAAAAAEAPGTLTLCAIGPLTNLARALEIDPEFVSNLKQLVIMGGSLDAGGNVTPHAEANFWNDPHAAHAVLTAPGGGKIIVVGLDVTTRIAFTAKEYDSLAEAAPQTGGFLREIGQFYMRFYQSITGAYQAFLHDPAALIACESPELFGMEAHRLAVVTEGERIGAMVRDAASPRLCRVCTTVDAQAVIDRYLEVVSRLD